MSLTPDQKRKRDREIKQFGSEWEYYIPSLELRRKKTRGFRGFINKIWKRKYKVKTLYIWAKEKFSGFQLLSHKFPLTHDNIIKPSNMPYIFALKNGWTIPEEDLKTLTQGPLLSEDGKLLVKQGGKFQYYWNKTWPVIVVISVLLSLIASSAFLLERIIIWFIGC